MADKFQFAPLLQKHIHQKARTPGQLATLSGVPKTTIESWLSGSVKRPRSWLPLAQVAKQLNLSKEELSQLLEAAGHPTFDQLLETITLNDDKEGLKWLNSWHLPAAPSTPAGSAPFQAIPRHPHFVGRAAQLANLQQALQKNRPHPIYTIEGMPGAGKTALAAEIAYLMRNHFVDGVLWARLDASDPMEILMSFAQAFGQDVSGYADLHSRSRVIRGLLAQKRALLVLDYVEESQAAEALCPPTGNCAVLLTTRQRNLPIARGGYQLGLAPFDPAKGESLALFKAILGDEFVEAETGFLSEIADEVGHLPLAVTIAASRLRYEPNWTPAQFLARLQKQDRKLAELSHETGGIRDVFSASIERLPAEQRRFFAALSPFGRSAFSSQLASHIAGAALEDAEDWLRIFYTLSLVNAGIDSSYALPPLIADYAAALLDDEQPIERYIAHFLAFADVHANSYEKLQENFAHMRNALQLAAGNYPQRHSRLTQIIAPFLFAYGYLAVAEKHLQLAVQHAQGAKATGYVTLYLAQLAERQGRSNQAQALYQELAAQLPAFKDEQRLATLIFQGAAWVAFQRGDYAQVQSYLAQAKTYLHRGMARLTRRHIMEKQVTVAQNEMEAAIRGYEVGGLQTGGSALAAQHIAPDESAALWGKAKYQLEQGLTLARTIGFSEGVGSGLLVALGWLALYRGQTEEANAYFAEGLDLAQSLQQLERISSINLGLGLSALRQKKLSEAEDFLQSSQEVAGDIRHQTLSAAALLAQGWVAIHKDDLHFARQAWQKCRSQLPASEQHPLISLVNVGLEIIEHGGDKATLTADFSEIEPLIWDILQTFSLTSLSQTIWR